MVRSQQERYTTPKERVRPVENSDSVGRKWHRAFPHLGGMTHPTPRGGAKRDPAYPGFILGAWPSPAGLLARWYGWQNEGKAGGGTSNS